MARGRKKHIIIIASFVLLAAGAYLLLSGARELVWPWWHQKQAAKNWPPPSPAPSLPVPKPEKPKSLDHSLFHRGDTVAQLSIPRLNGEWYVVEGSEDDTLRLG